MTQIVRLAYSLLFSLCHLAVTAEEPLLLSDDSTKLEIDFAGTHLGCTEPELVEVFKKGPNPVKFLEKTTDDADQTVTYHFQGHPRLADASFTGCQFWKGKLAAMTIMFSGEQSKETFEALRVLAEKKYGKMTDSIQFAGKTCTVHKDGMGVRLRFDSAPFRTPSTMVMALHEKLTLDIQKAAIEKRATELGSF